MNRRLRTTVPVLPSVLQPQVVSDSVVREREQSKRLASQVAHDARYRARELPPLSECERVHARDTGRDDEGVATVPGASRSYVVQDIKEVS